MYIGTIMHTDLVTVPPDTTLVEARELIESKGIDHLLVVNRKGRLVGIVSGRDLVQNWASPATALSAHELNYLLDKVQVQMIMVKTVVTVAPDTTIERAAYIMQTHNISSLPVMASPPCSRRRRSTCRAFSAGRTAATRTSPTWSCASPRPTASGPSPPWKATASAS